MNKFNNGLEICSETGRESHPYRAFPSTGYSKTHKRNYKSNKAYIDKSKTVSDATKPIRIKENTQWDNWPPTFINILRSIAGRNSVHLSYLCREFDEVAPHYPNINFMENYTIQIW